MKRLITLSLFLATLVYSCSTDPIEESIEATYLSKSTNKKKKTKVEICHYDPGSNSYVSLSISLNGLNGHSNHNNDIINFDMDGDGYPVENECGINFREDGLWDCDDNDPLLNPETIWYLDADGDGYAISFVQSCYSPGDDYSLDVMPLTDIDDNDSTVQNHIDCFNTIVGHYQDTNVNPNATSILDIYVSEHNSNYEISGTLTVHRNNGISSTYDLNLDLHSIIEMYTGFYSFRYDNNYPINAGSGYYDCGRIMLLIAISGSGIPGYQAFSAEKIN